MSFYRKASKLKIGVLVVTQIAIEVDSLLALENGFKKRQEHS